MHHKPYTDTAGYTEPARIKKLPPKGKGRHLKYRPKTPDDWEEQDF
jgi:hypothetical protein